MAGTGFRNQQGEGRSVGRFTEIGNRQWQVDRESGRAWRSAPGRDWHVQVPHPNLTLRAQGWRILFIFFCFFLCIVLPVLTFLIQASYGGEDF